MLPSGGCRQPRREGRGARPGRCGCTRTACGSARAQRPPVTKSPSSRDPALFLPPQGHCRFVRNRFFVETSSLPAGKDALLSIFTDSGQSHRSPVSPCGPLRSPVCPACRRHRLRWAGAGGGGSCGMETPLSSCSWITTCFVLPLSPAPPPLPFLRARKHRKNNFLCNFATGNPIPDKL